MIFPPLRDTAKKVLELLVALIIAKPVMVLAMSVGVSALGGIGATGEPGDRVGDNLARELGTLVAGVITFGLAAFMPFLVWKLMPIVAAAVVAQGIASAPMRGGTQAMQLQYYGQGAMRRLSGSSATGGASAGRMAGASGGGATAGGGAGAGFASGAAGGGASTAAASAASGPAAPVVAAAGAARATASATKSVATSTAESATSTASSPPSSGGRSFGGDRS